MSHLPQPPQKPQNTPRGPVHEGGRNTPPVSNPPPKPTTVRPNQNR